MFKDPIDTICETFTETASQQEKTFWKGDILHSVISVIYYRFEELLDSYTDRPDIIEVLLTRIRDLLEKFSDMSPSYQARMKLWTDMTNAHISPIARNRVVLISEACMGDNYGIDKDLNLRFLNLKPQQATLRRLAGICLTHFEQRIAEQIAKQKVTEETQADSPSRMTRRIETPSPTASPKA